MGTILRVLEKDVGMHDVFVGVEHRFRSDDLQECLIILARGAVRWVLVRPGRPVKAKKQHGTLLQVC